MTDCKHDWHFVQGLTERLRCTRCGLMTWPKDADEKVQEMFTDALVTGTGMLRVSSEGVQRIDPTSVYKLYEPPKPVGAWVIDPSGDEGHGPCTMFQVFNKPTDEQIKNTEAAFGWKWRDLQ